MWSLPRWSLFGVLAMAPWFSLRAADTPALTPKSSLIGAADLLKIKEVASPAFSPDGKWIAYTVKDVVEKPGSPDDYVYRTELWLAATDGSVAPRALTRGELAATSPQWSPDGRRLAFTRGE